MSDATPRRSQQGGVSPQAPLTPGFADALLAAVSDAVIAADAKGTVVFWNSAATDLFGYRPEEIMGRSLDLIIPEAMRGEHAAGMRRIAAGAPPKLLGRAVELRGLRADGATVPIEMRLSKWSGEAVYFCAVIRDISERRANEDRLHSLAHYDQLTLLPNRNLFLERVHETLAGGAEGPGAALLILDLDRFAEINDRQGSAVADALLCEVGVEVKRVGRDASEADATVARLGANQFGILLPGAQDVLAATAVADALKIALGSLAEREERGVSCSIGIAVSPSHGTTAAKLFANADYALRQAKREGGDRRRLFQPSHRDVEHMRRDLELDLRRAWNAREFEIFYQPQARLADGVVVGAEALLRWRHPTRGLLLPGVFLSAMTQTALAEHVGDFVVEEACRFAARRRAETGRPFRVGVNLFERQLLRPDQPSRIERALAESGLPPDDLELEIIETVMTGADDDSIRRVRRLRDVGVGIAFDDYGTGYASLGLLKRYPITRLKIDRSFVRDLATDRADKAIVELVLTLGRRFGFAVTAEGVETSVQAELLHALGCVEAQGWLFGRPAPASQWALGRVETSDGSAGSLVA